MSDTSGVSRRSPLSPHQYDVLAWIGQGCPDGVWDDFTYKTTAYALSNRGLVEVSKRGGRWTAALTADGRYYLTHHAYPPDIQRPTWKKVASPPRHPPSSVTEISPESVVEAVRAQKGTLTVPAPPDHVRQGYLAAIRQARDHGLVPDGFSLRYTGRNGGDLIITLVSLDTTTVPDTPALPAITIPETLDSPHPVVKQLISRSELLEVSDATRDRALRIVQAIADECGRRGYPFTLRDDGKPTFQITVGDDIFPFLLVEEWERREAPDPAEADAARYSWQRVRLTMQKLPSGRLALRLDNPRSGTQHWADRKRGSLPEKLPMMFSYLEQEAEGRREKRRRREAEQQRQQQAWESALEQARKDFLYHHNSQRLDQQIRHWETATARRRYADALDTHADTLEDPDSAEQVRDWARWVRDDADRLDPLLSTEDLSYRTPETVSSHDLREFMPPGMNPWTPPGSYR